MGTSGTKQGSSLVATNSGTLVATFGYFWPPPVPAEETLVAAFAPSITVQFHLSSPNLSAGDDPCGNYHLFFAYFGQICSVLDRTVRLQFLTVLWFVV